MSPKSDGFFTNELHSSSLKKKATQGGLITVGSQTLIFVFNLLATAILARLITPDDFGLIGMILVIINFLAVLILFCQCGPPCGSRHESPRGRNC